MIQGLRLKSLSSGQTYRPTGTDRLEVASELRIVGSNIIDLHLGCVTEST